MTFEKFCQNVGMAFLCFFGLVFAIVFLGALMNLSGVSCGRVQPNCVPVPPSCPQQPAVQPQQAPQEYYYERKPIPPGGLPKLPQQGVQGPGWPGDGTTRSALVLLPQDDGASGLERIRIRLAGALEGALPPRCPQ